MISIQILVYLIWKEYFKPACTHHHRLSHWNEEHRIKRFWLSLANPAFPANPFLGRGEGANSIFSKLFKNSTKSVWTVRIKNLPLEEVKILSCACTAVMKRLSLLSSQAKYFWIKRRSEQHLTYFDHILFLSLKHHRSVTKVWPRIREAEDRLHSNRSIS